MKKPEEELSHTSAQPAKSPVQTPGGLIILGRHPAGIREILGPDGKPVKIKPPQKQQGEKTQ